MLNHISKLSLFFVFAIAMIVTSCDKEGIDELTENFTTDTEQISEDARGDQSKRGGDNDRRGNSCYDLVYPLSISFPDGTISEAADQDALKEIKQAWKEANPDAEERPSLVFPIQIDQDGEVTDITDAEALQEAKQACGGNGNRGGDRGGRSNKCFSTVFPVTIAFADGTTAEVADKEAAKAAVEAWKEANPDAEGRASIAFPYNVQLQDSSVVSIDSEETLATLKETCSDGRGDNGRGSNDRGDNRRDGNRGIKCFSAVYPVTIVLPDGTTATVEDKAGKRAAIQAWKEANPDAEDGIKATIGFPLTVELTDGTQMTLGSQEELDALKATCSLEVEETEGN